MGIQVYNPLSLSGEIDYNEFAADTFKSILPFIEDDDDISKVFEHSSKAAEYLMSPIVVLFARYRWFRYQRELN